jgi:outer membrane receptor protein involved in Fe transport
VLLTAFLLTLACGATAPAQTSRGTVTGIVKDPAGAVVAGANVELVSKATNLKRATTTNDDGLYRFDAVDLGDYDLTIRSPGFKTLTNTGVQVQANRITTIDAQLEVGAAEVVVDVTAGPGEILQKDEAVRGGNFSTVQVRELPSANLNPYDLGRLLPGVTTATGSGASFGNASQFSVNGQRPRGNSYLIDGTENNDISVTGPANQINNEDAVQEVSVQTGLFSAEFGRAGGGVFNIITKSGTNEYHGTAKWLILSQVFDALTNTQKALSNLTRDGANGTNKLPVYTENIFGGTIGGPLTLPRLGEGGPAVLRGRDKNLFFFGIQWDRFRTTANTTPRVPTEASVQALRALFPPGTNPRLDLYLRAIGNVRGIPANDPRTVALGIGPNGAGASVFRAPITMALANVSFPRRSNDRQWVVRTDHNINDRHKLSIRYTDDDNIFTPNTIAVTPEFTTDFAGVSRNLLFTHTWIMSSSLTNELRVSPYGLIDFQFLFPPDVTDESRTLQNFSFQGTLPSTIGNATNLPQFRTAKNYLFQDTMTKVWNSHTFRFGAEFLKQTARQRPPFNERGSFALRNGGTFIDPTTGRSTTYSAFANFLDNFSGSSGTANINFGTPFYTPNLFRQSYFVQDTWKTTSNLTLTLGLRYENFGQPANAAFRFPAFAGFDPAKFLLPNKVKPDNNNFGPIVGFSYSPQAKGGPLGALFGEGRSVIRGGYQVSYDTFFNNLLSNIAADSPNSTSTTTTGSSAGRGTANFFPNALPSTARTPTALDQQTSVFNPNIRNPYTQRWSLGLQRELPLRLIMDLSYVGSAGRKLFVTEVLNPIANPSTGARLFPALGIRRYRTSGANSDYHSMQLRVDKRFSRDSLVTTSYTWSKYIDQISEVFATDSSNTSLASVPAFLGGLKLDRGPSDYHRKHRLVVSYVWDVPLFRERTDFAGKVLGGWQINGITTFQSGAPFTIVNGLDRNGDGDAGGDRPDVGNPNAPHNTRAQISTTCSTGLINPDTGACVTRNDVYVVQVAANTGTSLIAPGPATLGRNTERSGRVQNFDMSLFKIFRIRENLKLEYRVEAFNVFNHPQITGVPNRDVTGSAAGTFYNFNLLSGGNRSARMGLKILF